MTKVNEWISQLKLLSKIAAIEPQCAYCAFTAGFKHKVTFTMRTIPGICQHLQKLDQYVEKVFIPALTNGHVPNNIERKLLSLPVKLGGMGIVIFADIAKIEYQNSRNVIESLTKLHLEQTTEYNINRDELAKLKYNIKKEKLHCSTERFQSLMIDLATNQQNSFKQN